MSNATKSVDVVLLNCLYPITPLGNDSLEITSHWTLDKPNTIEWGCFGAFGHMLIKGEYVYILLIILL